MKMGEIRDLPDVQLHQRMADLHEELFNLRFQYATRQLTNHARLREVRHDMARIRTLLRQRELEEIGA